jgi:hypothetical protein
MPASDTDTEQYPLNVETVTENGVTLVKKTYELPTGADPNALAAPFERDGYSFTLRDILKNEQPSENLSRPAVKIAKAVTDSDDENEILAQFPETINHEEDGFSGRLTLDASSLVTEPEEYEPYTYTYTETEEYSPLDRNDPSLLEKEQQGMSLAGISFYSVTEEQVGDSLVPSSYAATATWSSTATGQRPVSYVTTASYRGELTKNTPGVILYTLIYAGTPIQQLDPTPVQEPTPEPEPIADPPTNAIIKEAEEAAEPIVAPSPENEPSFALSDDLMAWLIPAVVILILLVALLVQNSRSNKKERMIRRQNREAIEEIRRFIYGDAQRQT